MGCAALAIVALIVIGLLLIGFGMMRLAAREDKFSEDVYRSIRDPRDEEKEL